MSGNKEKPAEAGFLLFPAAWLFAEQRGAGQFCDRFRINIYTDRGFIHI
jgi:hypothetical protein